MRTIRFDGKDVILNRVQWIQEYYTENHNYSSGAKEPRYRIYMVFSSAEDDYLYEDYKNEDERDKRYKEVLNAIQGVNEHEFF